ncbi:lycopene cyclase domain-containing protein [Halogeometricum luteum]|uniref:Lycopene cyclase domain-containing protein n=1 Tax=Halogeometricum luteum TaxID=2950537 RepID=A0ABU2G3R3_9EURY|nr:lycopene cyclase domain-containing protein [Halogeometricum sp. S3BR5-2]MDS0295424.1 lycopene cyclase domain-containing protein [Halogeometricum sp. S3BR5-2]
MGISRHGHGALAAGRALGSQVHPVFMLPPVAAAAFGAILAAEAHPVVLLAHLLAIFFSVYTAHVKDGYVDFHVRGEDDDHPLTAGGCRLALVAAGAGFAACLAVLWFFAGPLAVLVTLPAWVIGVLHAPQLDTNPVTTTAGYPLGIAVALFGGYYVQTLAVAAAPLAFAGVFFVLLCGVKVIDDSTDYEYDRSIGKRTVAVALGRRRARRFAHALVGVALVATLWFAVDGLFPPSAVVAAALFGVVAAVSLDADPGLATMLLVRGAYVFLAVLVVGVWFAPLTNAPLPDIGALGPYTYLATELVFGTVAFALLARAGRGALWSAVRTIAVLYPVAYLWDWYTLEVGVFEIVLRTGVDLFGIPLEEHLFMVVVPAFVLGLHETLRRSDREVE